MSNSAGSRLCARPQGRRPFRNTIRGAALLPGAPPLRWTLQIRSTSGEDRRLAALLGGGEGVRFRAEAVFATGDEIRWRLEAAWNDGALRDVAGRWSIEGLAARADIILKPMLVNESSVHVSFAEARAAGLILGGGDIEFGVGSDQTVRVRRATGNILGGRMEVVPFTFVPGARNIRSVVLLDGLVVRRIADYLPPVLTNATGRVDGRVDIGWSERQGFVINAGSLRMAPGEPASMLLAPSPGFLTRHTTSRVTVLPAWLGPLARALTLENPAYATLRAIEMGELILEVGSLKVDLHPRADQRGRSARVVISARPADANAVESLRFEINVAGPLDEVIALGSEGKLDVKMR